MFAENRKISLRQLQVLLLLDCFGTAVLFLPAELAQLSGNGCWFLALGGGITFTVSSILLSLAGSRMAEGTAVEWFRSCFGPFGGTALLLGLAGNLLFSGFTELRIFSEVVCRTMLPNTPLWIISLVIIAVGMMWARQGAECRGRGAEILFFMVIIPILVILISVAVSAEYGNVRPWEFPDFRGFLGGIGTLSMTFQGLLFLYFVFPNLRKISVVRKKTAAATGVIAATITGITFLCLAVYGDKVLSEKMLPTLQMLERVSFTGVFLIRQDVLLLWFWMASVSLFLSGVLLYGELLGKRILGQEEGKGAAWIWGWGILIFIFSFLPEDLSAAYRWKREITPWFSLIYLWIIPLLLLWRGKGASGCE